MLNVNEIMRMCARQKERGQKIEGKSLVLAQSYSSLIIFESLIGMHHFSKLNDLRRERESGRERDIIIKKRIKRNIRRGRVKGSYEHINLGKIYREK